MQRTEQGYVIISCDFCGVDWDEVIPMIEGHKGSVLCLNCMKQAIGQLVSETEPYKCTMCVKDGLPGDLRHWRHPSPTPSPGLNVGAIMCIDCLQQANKTFGRDKDIDWKAVSIP